jgi:hypothetical protein
MTFALLDRWVARLLSRLGAFTDRRHWIAWTVALACGISLIAAFPSYDQLSTPGSKLSWHAILVQVEHPLTSRQYAAKSHESKLAFRLTVPVVGHVLGLGRTGLLILQGLAGLALLAVAAALLARLTGDRVIAALLTIATASTWAGATAFVDLRGIFDSVALALLAGAAYARRPALVALLVLAACFTDERAVLAAGFIAVFHEAVTRRRALVAATAAGIAAYAAGRLYLAHVTDLHTGGGGVHVGDFWNQGILGAWTGVEGLWLVIALGAAALLVQRRFLLAAVLAVLCAAVAVAATAVLDTTRSFTFMLPMLFVAVGLLGSEPSERLRRVALAASVASILWPLYYDGGGLVQPAYPLPVQLARWVT